MKNTMHVLAIALAVTTMMSCNNGASSVTEKGGSNPNAKQVNQVAPTPTATPSYSAQKLQCFITTADTCTDISTANAADPLVQANDSYKFDTGIVSADGELTYSSDYTSSTLSATITDDASKVSSTLSVNIIDSQTMPVQMTVTVHGSDSKDYTLACYADRGDAKSANIANPSDTTGATMSCTKAPTAVSKTSTASVKKKH